MIKKYFNNIWFSYAIALTISFMLFICEPIVMYSNNINDFWFDLSKIVVPLLIMFIATFVFMILFINLFYFTNKRLFYIINTIVFICFICTYIQGNYLVGNLPILDGTPINWSSYKIENAISIILWIVVIIVSLVLIKKFGVKNYLKYGGYLTVAIFFMLTTSFVSTLFTTDVLKQKHVDVISTATQKNINVYSSNENMIILLLDAVDSMYFKDAMENNKELAKNLKDFTYYPDTMSMYPFTAESIPHILSGIRYENETQYTEYFVNAMNNSKLLNELYNNNYDVNIYECDLYYYDNNALKISNVVNFNTDPNCKMDYTIYGKNQLKYILFRYLPYPLKKYSKIETMNFKNTMINTNELPFADSMLNFMNYTRVEKFETKEQKNFKFIHLTGAHVPFTFDKDLNEIDNAKYEDEIEGSLTLLKKYFDFLKEKGIYDNSIIVVMADHGYAKLKNEKSILEGRQNPILFVKGKEEKHKKMITSNKAISYSDLQEGFIDLINDKKSKELFNNIDKNRKRKYLLYKFGEDNHMVEYEMNGKAWETDKLKKTGNEYIRK